MDEKTIIVSDTVSNSSFGAFITIRERQETNQTSLRHSFKLTCIANEPVRLYGKYTWSLTYDDYDFKLNTTGSILNNTYTPGESLLQTTFMTPLYIPFPDYDSTGNKTLTATFQATYQPLDDTTTAFTQEAQLQIELSPLSDSGDIVLTELTDEDKQRLLDGTVAIRTKIIVQRKGASESITLTEEDAIKSWEISDERYVPELGFVGQFTARTLSGELHNISDDFNIEDREIKLLIGVTQLGSKYQYLIDESGAYLLSEDGSRLSISELDEDITTWYSLGNFLITKPEDDEVSDNTRFEAFDYTTKFNIDFNANYTNNNHPVSLNTLLKNNGSVTASWLAKYTCSQAGVELGNTLFTNHDFIISSNQFTSGESCRDVMRAIAQLAFGWCRIGWDNKCYIDEVELDKSAIPSYNKITNDNYYSLTTQKNEYGPINRIVLGMSSVQGTEAIAEDITSINDNGLTELYIDNPMLYTEELRQTAIAGAEKLLGFTYGVFETETPGHPWLRGNELIIVKNMEDTAKYTYPFNRTIKYTGHIKTDIAAVAPTQQEQAAMFRRTIYKTIKDVKIQVNKQEGLINIVNSNVKASQDGLSKLEERFDMEITDSYSKQEIKEIITGVSADGTVVESVKSAAGTFDMNGLTIEQSNADTKTNINANGMVIYNKTGTIENDQLLEVNSNGVIAKNVKVSTYLNIGAHSRVEDYVHEDGSEGTGVFWIGSDY